MILRLTHGAGSNSDTVLLRAVDEALTAAGVSVTRYDLPFRQKRASGSPVRGDAERDRAGIIEGMKAARTGHPGDRVIAGGHSYGGRMSTMAAADDPSAFDGLLLLSYPLHPPLQRDKLRTEHFPKIQTPCLFVHGTRDQFGLPDEMRSAVALIPARTELLLIDGAGHDLKKAGTPARIAEAFFEFFSRGA